MKKKFLWILLSFLLAANTFLLGGCDLLGFLDEGGSSSSSSGYGNGELPEIDNSVDLEGFTPPTDDTDYIEGETYYTSVSIDFVTEINGNYTVDKPFTLDEENENKRIYHNVYLYVGDFFQVLYYKNVGDLGQVFAIMADSTDQEYAEVEYTEQGSPLQINVIKQGVYNLILDVETLAIDMVKIDDIDVPVYETIKTCELNVHVSLSEHTYTPMTLNTATNEYYIETDIPLYASIGFYSASHMSHYKITAEPSLTDTLIYYNLGLSGKPSQVQVHVGGRYKIYFNAKTYVLRLELQNPDTASYFCQVGFNQGNELTPLSSATPYLFEYEFNAQGTATNPYVDLPSFYPYLGMSYDLSVIDVDGFVFNDDCVTESGTYKLTVDLKNFTLTVDRIS